MKLFFLSIFMLLPQLSYPSDVYDCKDKVRVLMLYKYNHLGQEKSCADAKTLKEMFKKKMKECTAGKHEKESQKDFHEMLLESFFEPTEGDVHCKEDIRNALAEEVGDLSRTINLKAPLKECKTVYKKLSELVKKFQSSKEKECS